MISQRKDKTLLLYFVEKRMKIHSDHFDSSNEMKKGKENSSKHENSFSYFFSLK
jgi:hypothetical protein